jgi:alpha-L-fucosidase
VRRGAKTINGPADPLDRQSPPWFDEAKLGIFIHWNAASIPAYAPIMSFEDLMGADPTGAKAWRRLPFAEAYQNSLAIPGSDTARHHAETYGDLPYDAFVAQLRDEMIPQWSPEPWADLFARAGARYVVLTTKQDDGFLLWPSETRNPHRERWQAERDVVGELAAAVRAGGMRFGTYYCGMDWTFGGFPVTNSATMVAGVPQSADYVEYADAHWRELIDRYEPCVLWNDYSYPEDADIAGLFRYYLERVPDGLINNRFDGDMLANAPSEIYSDFVTPEYSVEGSPDLKWEACRGIGTSFGYNRLETDASYLSATELIHLFVDVVSRGGNLLLNVGPTGRGEIPWAQANRLLALGWWLRTNGGAIYNTRPWDRTAGITGEGFRVHYTTSPDAVHAIVLGTPRRAQVEIDVRLDERTVVTLEGNDHALPWTEAPTGSRITLPEAPDEGPGFALRISPRSGVHPFDER